MAKRLFLLLFASFIGIISSPIYLAADDYFLVGKPVFNEVETVPLPEPNPEPELEPTPKLEPTPVANIVESSPVIAVNTPQAQALQSPVVNYTVSFFIGSYEEYGNTAYSLSYSGLYRFKKMVYGHNTASLLGNLSGRHIGETITITENGVVKTYRVADIRVYRKTADGNLENDSSLMASIATTAQDHDVALFTCAGTSYGNGDASHRLVVFANQV